MQANMTPSMPVEIMEYEAYVAGSDAYEVLAFNGRTGMFNRVYFSVDHNYSGRSKEPDVKLLPEWMSAGFFVKEIDGITLEDLSEYNRQTLEFENDLKNLGYKIKP